MRNGHSWEGIWRRMQLYSNQWKLWKRVNEGKREKGGPVHLSGKDGQRLTDQADTTDRWKEQFEILFQEDAEVSEQPHPDMCQENNGGICEEEIRRAVNRLRGGKAPGECNVVPEMLKAGGEVAFEWLVKLLCSVTVLQITCGLLC